MSRPAGERIELIAMNPQGDVACDTGIATPAARVGIAEGLASGIIRPVREIEGGIEARFRPDAWDTVKRYIDLESRCCSFLTLSATRDDTGVILRVTGRDDAVPFNRSLFA